MIAKGAPGAGVRPTGDFDMLLRMTNRILLAGLLAGLALFVWEFIAHDMTPLGSAGLSTIPNESGVRTALKQALPQDGLYYFPAPTDVHDKAAMDKAMQEARTGPRGLLVIQPNGGDAISARQLLTQFVADVLSMIVAAFLLARIGAATFLARMLFVTALGLLPGLRAQIPMWNWYAFPASYAMAQTAIDLVGFALGGLVLAKMVQSRARTMAAAS
jgi:hypothetical protein